MEKLSQKLVDQGLDENGYERSAGFRPVETTLEELAKLDCRTDCGSATQTCPFVHLLVELGLPLNTRCRGWYIDYDNFVDSPAVSGMFHIEIDNEAVAEKIEEVAGICKASLRPNGPSVWRGFWEFEIE